MAEVEFKYYVCECCENTFDSADVLRKLQVPCRNYDKNGERFVKSFKELALCLECWSKLWEICDREFATVEVGYKTKVFRHFGEDEKHDDDLSDKRNTQADESI